MKGFIHVVEIIIISIVMFFILFQFSIMPMINTDWEKTKLNLMANDLVATLNAAGVNWTDENSINGNLTGLLSNNTLYDVKVKDSSGINLIVYNEINDPVVISFYDSIPQSDGSTEFREVIFSLGFLF